MGVLRGVLIHLLRATFHPGMRQSRCKREWYQLSRSEKTRVKTGDQGTEGRLGREQEGIMQETPSIPSNTYAN